MAFVGVSVIHSNFASVLGFVVTIVSYAQSDVPKAPNPLRIMSFSILEPVISVLEKQSA